MKVQNMSWIFYFGLILLTIILISCGHKSKSKDELPFGFSNVNDSIWYNGELLKDVDAASFEILDEYFSKDKNQVFYHRTYRESRDYFISKKRFIYKLSEADPSTFISLKYGYAKDKTTVWNKDKSFEVSDITSLIALDHQFVKDKNYVYLQNKKLGGVEGESFDRINSFYAKDKQKYFYIYSDQVNYELKPVDCDYRSFELIDFTYTKDKNHVFFNGEKIKYSFSKDLENVFFRNKVIDHADPNTFILFEENETSLGETYYAKDKSNIYINDRIFSGADISTFKVLNEKYCTDKNGVYFQMKKVKNADPLSFNVYPHYFGDADAEDKNHKFGDGKIVN